MAETYRTGRTMIGGEMRTIRIPESALTGAAAAPPPGITFEPPPPPGGQPQVVLSPEEQRAEERKTAQATVNAIDTAAFAPRALASGAASLPALGAEAMNYATSDPSLQGGTQLFTPGAALGLAESIAPPVQSRAGQAARTLFQNLGAAAIPVGVGGIFGKGLADVGAAATQQLARLTPAQIAKAEAIAAVWGTAGEEGLVQLTGRDDPIVRIVGSLSTVLGLGTTKALIRAVHGVTGVHFAPSSEALVRERVQEALSSAPQDIKMSEEAIAEAQRLQGQIPSLQLSSADVIPEGGVGALQRGLTQQSPEIRAAVERRTRENLDAIKTRLGDLPGQDGNVDDVITQLNQSVSDYQTSLNQVQEEYGAPVAKFLTDVDAGPSATVAGQTVQAAKMRIEQGFMAKAATLYDRINGNSPIRSTHARRIQASARDMLPAFVVEGKEGAQRIGEGAITDLQVPQSVRRAASLPPEETKFKDLQVLLREIHDDLRNETSRVRRQKLTQLMQDTMGELDEIADSGNLAAQDAIFLKEANAYFRPRVQALRGDVLETATRLGGQGQPITSPEFLVPKLLSSQKGATEVNNLLNTFAEEFPQDVAELRGAVNSGVKRSFYAFVDPDTGKFDAAAAGRWLKRNKEALAVFPDLQAELSAVRRSQVDLKNIQDVLQPSLAEHQKAIAADVLQLNTPELASDLIFNAKNPTAKVRELMARVRGNVKAEAGVKRMVFDGLAARAGGTASDVLESPVVRPKVLGKILDQGESALLAAGYSKQDIGLLRDIQKAATMVEAGAEVGDAMARKEPENIRRLYSLMSQLDSRVWAFARGAVGLPFIASLSMAERVSDMLRQMSSDQARSVLHEALFNPENLHTIRLMTRPAVTPATLQRRWNAHLLALGQRSATTKQRREQAKESP